MSGNNTMEVDAPNQAASTSQSATVAETKPAAPGLPGQEAAEEQSAVGNAEKMDIDSSPSVEFLKDFAAVSAAPDSHAGGVEPGQAPPPASASAEKAAIEETTSKVIPEGKESSSEVAVGDSVPQNVIVDQSRAETITTQDVFGSITHETATHSHSTTTLPPKTPAITSLQANGTRSTEAENPNLAIVSASDDAARRTPLEVRLKRTSSPPRITRTGYVYDPLMMLHAYDGYVPTADHVTEQSGGHPEEPMRIKRIFSRLAENGLIKRMRKLEFAQVSYEQATLVHTEDHWNKVQGTETLTDQYIHESKHYYDQLSLYVCRETAHCARLSCGGVIQACLSVCKGEVRNAFAIVRPPGHHAEPDEHMGFCFFNNVAVAAKEVIKQNMAKKVLILDWDVHHGNGTQRAFWNDPNVLYISLHRHDGGKFYPTSDFGALDMVGADEGEGKSVNIPWPSGGFGDADYIYAFQKIVMPIAYEFAPDLVIISAGFDAAEGDQLGQCNVTPPAYGHMTHMLCALAGGKVVVALEGGYNLEAISRSALAVAQVLLGETPAELGVLEASEVATEVVHQVAKVQSKYWKSIDVKACEPPEVTAAAGDGHVIPIPDLLKIHRAHHMFTKYGLFQIPLASPELEDAFGGQVICNEGVYEGGAHSVLVVFVHDFGNLRVETDGVSTTNVHLENSYLLDTSDKIVDWTRKSGFSIIDVNVLAAIPTELPRTGPRMVSNRGPKGEGQLIRYIWDNYVELSEAENVVFIGHGTGCGAVMELINHRDVQQKVKAVVQVAGLHSLVRIDPDNEARRDWFRKSNRIYVPSSHPVLSDDRVKKRLGGQIFTSDKAKVVDVLVDAFPEIQSFIASKLNLPPPPTQPTTTTLTNGHTDTPPPASQSIITEA